MIFAFYSTNRHRAWSKCFFSHKGWIGLITETENIDAWIAHEAKAMQWYIHFVWLGCWSLLSLFGESSSATAIGFYQQSVWHISSRTRPSLAKRIRNYGLAWKHAHQALTTDSKRLDVSKTFRTFCFISTLLQVHKYKGLTRTAKTQYSPPRKYSKVFVFPEILQRPLISGKNIHVIKFFMIDKLSWTLVGCRGWDPSQCSPSHGQGLWWMACAPQFWLRFMFTPKSSPDMCTKVYLDCNLTSCLQA